MDIDEFFKELDAEIAAQPWWKKAYWRLYRAVRNLPHYPRELKWMWQRVHRGWSDRDSWDMSRHLAKIVPEMIENVRPQRYSFPVDICTTCDDPYGYHGDGCDGAEQLDATLVKIADGFRAAEEEWDSHDFDKDVRAAREARRIAGMEVFVKWYYTLGD